MRSVLVTGGAGFIGSALVRGLLAEPGVERVAVIDNFFSGKEANLSDVWGDIEFHQADIRRRPSIEPLFDGFDTVFHEAAIPSVPLSIDEPELCHQVNVDGTFNVLRAAVERKVRRVLFAASSAGYGNTPDLPKREDMLPEPQSPYAAHKIAGEQFLKAFHRSYGLETVALRYFNVFGPRQDPASPYSGVLSIFISKILERRPPAIFGDGEQSRDFIHVDDIVRLNLLAARSQRAAGRLYNGGTGRRTSLNEIWALIQEIEGVDLPAAHGPEREGDVRHSQADISRAREELGFAPRTGLTDGLRSLLDWERTVRC